MGKAQLKVDLRMISQPKKFILSSDNAKLCLIERIFPVTYFKKKQQKTKNKTKHKRESERKSGEILACLRWSRLQQILLSPWYVLCNIASLFLISSSNILLSWKLNTVKLLNYQCVQQFLETLPFFPSDTSNFYFPFLGVITRALLLLKLRLRLGEIPFIFLNTFMPVFY